MNKCTRPSVRPIRRAGGRRRMRTYSEFSVCTNRVDSDIQPRAAVPPLHPSTHHQRECTSACTIARSRRCYITNCHMQSNLRQATRHHQQQRLMCVCLSIRPTDRPNVEMHNNMNALFLQNEAGGRTDAPAVSYRLILPEGGFAKYIILGGGFCTLLVERRTHLYCLIGFVFV